MLGSSSDDETTYNKEHPNKIPNEIKPKLHRFSKGFRGKLRKQGKVFKQWRELYFVLETKKIRYFNDETMANLIGELIIDGQSQLYDVQEEYEGMKHLFCVISKTTSGHQDALFLSAFTEKDKQDWVEVITDMAQHGSTQIFQPDIWPTDFTPSVELGITFKSSGVIADNGNILRPFSTENSPEVILKGVGNDEKYSLVMMDIDPICAIDNPANKYYLHWGIINFYGKDIKSGDELAPYVPPAPVYNSGLHRYFFILFKQKANISTTIVLNEIVELFSKREGFNFMKWVRLMDFVIPASINGFYAGWEEYCDELHDKLQYIPPASFKSPAQEMKSNQEHGGGSGGDGKAVTNVELMKVQLFTELGLSDLFPFDSQELLQSTEDSAHQNHHSSPPIVSLHIKYNDQDIVKDGGFLAAASAQTIPTIQLQHFVNVGQGQCTAIQSSSLRGEYYTLFLLDPDLPSKVNPFMKEMVHYLVVNIPADQGLVNTGTTLLSYLPPIPPYHTGLHRYVFVLYKQHTLLNSDMQRMMIKAFQARTGVQSHTWIQNLTTYFQPIPIALDVFLSEWDASVDAHHQTMNWLPPAPYRSPKQTLLQAPEYEATAVEAMSLNELEEEVHRLKRIREDYEEEQRKEVKRLQQELANVTAELSPDKLPRDVVVTEKDEEEEEEEEEEYQVITNTPFRSSLPPPSRSQPSLAARPVSMAASSTNHTPDPQIRTKGILKQPSYSSSSRHPSLSIHYEDLQKESHANNSANLLQLANDLKLTSKQIVEEEVLVNAQEIEERTREETTQQQQVVINGEETVSILAHKRTPSLKGIFAGVGDGEPVMLTEEEGQKLLGLEVVQNNLSQQRQQHQKEQVQAQQQVLQNEGKETPDRLEHQTSVDSHTKLDWKPSDSKIFTTGATPSTPRGGEEKPSALRASSSISSSSSARPTKSVQLMVDDKIFLSPSGSNHHISTSASTSNHHIHPHPHTSTGSTTSTSHPPAKKVTSFALDDLDDLFTTNKTTLPDESYDDEENSVSNHSRPTSTISKTASNETTDSFISPNSLFRRIFRSQSQFMAPTSSESLSAVPPRPKRLASSASMYFSTNHENMKVVSLADTLDKCMEYDVGTASIFDGEIMRKKFSTDFITKDSIIWIDPKSKTLHWAKSTAERNDPTYSKYIVLGRHHMTASNTSATQGELKGVFKSLEVLASGNKCILRMESDETLELKLSADGSPVVSKRLSDWVKIIKELSSSP